MPDVILTPAQRKAAERFLAEFPANARRKGEALFRAERVGELVCWSSNPKRFETFVLGSQTYEARVWLDDEADEEIWDGDCTCPVEFECKHCYAAMRALIANGARIEEVETFEDEDEDDFRPVGATRKAPAAKKAKVVKPGAAKAPAPAVKQAKAPPQPSSAEAMIESKLGRPIASGENKYVKLIADLHLNYRNQAKAPESAVAEFYGPPMGWSWHQHVLWPAPPADPWETWLYVAHHLRKTGKPVPEFLDQITPADAVQALVGPWKWREQVHHWQENLQQSLHGDTQFGEPPMELRVMFEPKVAVLLARQGQKDWAPLNQKRFDTLKRSHSYGGANLTTEANALFTAFRLNETVHPELPYKDPRSHKALVALLGNPFFASYLAGANDQPLHRAETPLHWIAQSAASEMDSYRFSLVLPDGTPPPPALLFLNGPPALYLTHDAVFEAAPLGRLKLPLLPSVEIPAPALESAAGVALLEAAAIPLPARLAARVERRRARLIVEARLATSYYRKEDEYLQLQFLADWGDAAPRESLTPDGWRPETLGSLTTASTNGTIVTLVRDQLQAAAELASTSHASWSSYSNHWERRVTKKFPEEFGEWLASLPEGIELRLDPLLASLRDNPLAARVRLDVEPAGVDWFDLSVELDLPEIELTPEELQALLGARGGWVRLGKKGWQRLTVQLTEEEDRSLADLGLSPRDLAGGEKQRLHALQLSQAGANRLLPADRVEELRLRTNELKARVAPATPPEITAELRPYQIEGFHFLAYLTTNSFGGLLADDMGLGKTVQTLTWLTWLRAQRGAEAGPSLVVCPKSVMDNWGAESARFAPHLKVKMWSRGTTGDIATAAREHDLLVLNYTQLRLMEDELTRVKWLAVILDEAQAIKNPDSQTTRAACALDAGQRLALTGTPIENRLLDLWSIMAFTMPGVLGPRARFARTYDQKDDPLARRRLAARTRPFVIRRTKGQVARDLPARVEEELLCEMEGRQQTLYRAELKRARQELLKLKTAKELDGARFHILTSLLRLRQICCHPGLVEAESIDKPSAKLEALLELLEPLIEEGHKVLVFSQFVGVIEILQKAIAAREWPHFVLTGQTEDRGDLIRTFQETPGAAVFLLSLKASGFGLNLTAASYVVLYDPWWNPAVENQAIDRTHRIGQTSTVFAYRLIIKESIEEKIRALQKQKRALAEDILGEEAFARALTLDDLKMLLSE